VRLAIVVKKKARAKIFLVVPATCNTSVIPSLVAKLCAAARTAAIVKHHAQILRAEKVWSRHLKVDVEQRTAWWSSVVRKKTLALVSSVGQGFSKACLTITVAIRFHALEKIAVTQRRTVMTTGALKEWFAVATLVVVALGLARTSSAVCQRRTAATTCVRTACSSQMMGLVAQPVALMISVV